MSKQRVVCAIVIKNKRLLLVRKEKHFLLPGGKLIGSETEEECLVREFSEELPKLEINLETLRFFKKIAGTASRKGYKLFASVYFADVKGRITHGKESEINKSRWVGAGDIEDADNVSDVVRKVAKYLTLQGYM